MITPKVGGGLPLWMPKGTILRETLEKFLREEQRKRGYLPVVTPHIGNLNFFPAAQGSFFSRFEAYPVYIDPVDRFEVFQDYLTLIRFQGNVVARNPFAIQHQVIPCLPSYCNDFFIEHDTFYRAFRPVNL